VVQQTLEQLYGSINRIDAFVGTFSEDHVEGAETGPLCIASIQEQFLRLRDGDRFFYRANGTFTEDEISIIETTKLQELITRNFPEMDINALPVSAFFLDERQLTAFKPKQAFKPPETQAEGLPWALIQLTDVYNVYWAINRDVDPQTITFHLQVQTDGWAGIGFSPDQKGSMKGADIVLCRILDDVPECRDSKAFDVGVPLLDTDVGGENSIRDVNVTREDGVLYATFTRDLMTHEPAFDNPIPDAKIRIIFAFNPVTNELKYHGPTRNPDTVINWQDYKGPPVKVPISKGVTGFLYAIVAISVLATFLYIFLVITKKEYFRFQTPEFCILICVGAILGYISVLLILPDNQNDKTCWAHIWLFGMSFWLVFLGFFIKVARVYYIVLKAEQTMEIVEIPVWQLLVPISFAMLCEAGFNIGWDVGIPPDLEREDFLESNEYTLFCAGNRYMWLGSVVFRAVFLGVGVLLALQTRRLPKEVNWSKEIAVAIYTMAIILGIGIPLGYAITGSSTMVVILKGVTIVIAYLSVTTIVFWDSVRRIFQSKGPREVTKSTHGVSRTTGRGTDANSTA